MFKKGYINYSFHFDFSKWISIMVIILFLPFNEFYFVRSFFKKNFCYLFSLLIVFIISLHFRNSEVVLGDPIKNHCIKSVDYAPGHHNYDSSSFLIITNPKPWYLTNGTRYPMPANISKKTGIRDAALLPEEDPESDRILNQMMFIPPNYDPSYRKKILKTINVQPNFPSWWKINNDNDVFANCTVNTCRIRDSPATRKNADLVLFNQFYVHTNELRSPNQIYAMYYSEPPIITSRLEHSGKIKILCKCIYKISLTKKIIQI